MPTGDKIIEVGVGTGISLPLYPRHCKVVGIDLTKKMLDQAERKKERHGLTHVELMEMDAERMTFDDDTFDHAVAAFVITVVPNPEKMVAEMKRVTKKGGTILIFNHFCSNNAFISWVEKSFLALVREMGMAVRYLPRPPFQSLQPRNQRSVQEERRLDPWSIIIATNNK